jgi:PHD/YefM family antitoxin component YafN of YafNO toxin-antitoxin module
MKAMTASEARQNFGQFLDYGIQEPVVIKRHQRDLGVFLPMALYRNLVSAQNRKITRSMDKLQAEARRSGLTCCREAGLMRASATCSRANSRSSSPQPPMKSWLMC